jgi:L-2-hydroxyglutarate oxidase LhgO
MPDRLDTDAVVIGAGVVGLACARALALRGHDVLVIEALDSFGTVTSSRNSEVIHAGLHYPPNSSKARLCVAGKHRLYEYCAARGIAHRRCEKLIVATSSDQVAHLDSILEVARANGVRDLSLLTAAQANELEPELRCVAALRSPSTGIVDSHAFMLALLADLESHGGNVIFRSPLLSAAATSEGIELHVGGQEPATLMAGLVVNAAGLNATHVARRIDGLRPATIPDTRYCKGNYFGLEGRAPFSRLVYPVPEAAGLGVHLTLDLGGQARFGPDTEWLSATDPASIDYAVDPERGNAFHAEIRRYWPGLRDGSLSPAYSGVRPKIFVAGAPVGDFMISGPATHGIPNLVSLFGIESPGLTASLALADAVVQALEGAPRLVV